MKIIREYKQNNAVYVTMQTLQCLYYSFEGAYPRKIKNELSSTLKSLIDYIEKDYDYPDDATDYVHELIEKVTCETK